MAQRSYRASLANAQYPFRLRNIGEAVMMSGIDATSNQRYVTRDTLKAAVGIPQLVHAINILPTLNGYASVKSVARHTDTPTLLSDDVLAPHYVDMYDDNGVRLKVFVFGAFQSTDAYLVGFFFISPTGYSTRVMTHSTTTLTQAEVEALVLTSGFAQGRQYFYTSHTGLGILCGTLENNDLTLVHGIEMTGLAQTDILGIVIASGFIIAYAAMAAGWSTTLTLTPEAWIASTAYTAGELVVKTGLLSEFQYYCTTAGTSGSTEPAWPTTVGSTVTDGSITWTCQTLAVDFEPSETTGAGGGNIEELRGPILCCQEVASGFIAYTKNNCVMCAYTGDYNYPFTFRNVSGSSGIVNRGCVTVSSTGSMHYVVSRSGISQVSALGIKSICDPLSEILQDTDVDRYTLTENADGTYTQTASTLLSLITQIEFVADRYLCVMRGDTAQLVTDVYIYDTILERYGKLDVECLTVFTCSADADTIEGTAGSCIGLVLSGARRFALTADDMEDTSAMESLALFGPFKYIRDQWIELQEIRLSSIASDALVVPVPLGADGEQLFDASAATWYEGTDKRRSVWFTSTGGDSVLLAVKGRFNLSSMVLTFTTGGHM